MKVHLTLEQSGRRMQVAIGLIVEGAGAVPAVAAVVAVVGDAVDATAVEAEAGATAGVADPAAGDGTKPLPRIFTDLHG